jgi:hypothetical protein
MDDVQQIETYAYAVKVSVGLSGGKDDDAWIGNSWDIFLWYG